MKSFGPLYVGSLQYWHKKALPIVEIGTTQETEHPYRKGKCLVIRAPFTHPGYFLGVWVKNPDIHPDDDEAIDRIYSEALISRKAWEPKDGLYEEFF
jgi:hypothetical protein